MNKGKPVLFWGMLLACAAWLTVEALASRREELSSVTILAEPSMAGPIARSAVDFSQHRNIVTSAVFADASRQIQSLEEGAAGDVFITDDFNILQELKKRGLVDVYSQIIIGRGDLALAIPETLAAATGVTPESSREAVAAYLTAIPRISVISPEGPESRYWISTMLALGLSESLQEKILPASGYEEAIHQAREQNLPVLLPAQVLSAHKGFTVLFRFKGTEFPAFTYYAVIVASENMEPARDYLHYLQSAEGQQFLIASGLEIVGGK